MEYITDIYVGDKRVATHARLETAFNDYVKIFDDSPFFETVEAVITFEKNNSKLQTVITDIEDFESFLEGRQRAVAWKPEKEDFFDEYALKHGSVKGRVASRNFNTTPTSSYKEQLEKWGSALLPSKDVEPTDAINPSHYKDIIPGYQYMEMMVHMLKDLDGVESHLKGQVYKYLMRCGKKDEELQELKKAKWYLDALVKYHEEGKVI